MSTILEKVKTAQKAYRKSAIKDKDATAKIKGGVLTTLIGEVETKQKGSKGDITDVEVVALIKKFVNNIVDSLALRSDYDLIIELAELESYIPNQVSEEDLEVEIASLLADAEQPLTMKAMGKVMGVLKTTHGAALDTAVASTIVKRIIAEST